ncbi:Phosphotransferase system, mannose/fructose/sorbose family IID component, partial [sediment metagenome]
MQAALWRSLFIQTVWSFERLLGFGLAMAMLPALRRLYPDKKRRGEIIKEYMGFFNTHPYMATSIIGVLLKEEENLAARSDFSRERISALKIQMMGPLAALGDTFFWAALRPLASLLGAGLVFFFWEKTNLPSFMSGSLVFFLFFNIPHVFARWAGLCKGYRRGMGFLKDLKKINLLRLSSFLAGFGSLLTGLCLGWLISSSGLSETAVLGQPKSALNAALGVCCFSLFGWLVSAAKPERMVWLAA